MSNIVALLPMKANSERVPGKNFRLFLHKPLFKWILDSLLAVPAISRVVINTDARQILAEHGLVDTDRVLIRDRRPQICGDLVSMNRIIEDDIHNVDADVYLMTHTTNPLLSAQTIGRALDYFNEHKATGAIDSLFTVNRIQTRLYTASGEAINHDPDNLVRTQDLEPWFEENSNLYIFTPDSFRASGARIGKSPGMYETPKFESLDIDEPEDWDMALAAAQFLHGDNS